MFINKALIYGNITRDIELRTTQGGTSVASFSVATNRKYKVDGQQKEDVQFHNCVAWGKTAELMHQYLGKGSGVFIEGRLQTRKWEDKKGVTHYSTEIVVENMQFGPKSAGGGGNRGGAELDPDSEVGGGEAIEVVEVEETPDDFPL